MRGKLIKLFMRTMMIEAEMKAMMTMRRIKTERT